MPQVEAHDGTRLHVEMTGEGPDLLFIHEFAGDHRSWESQVSRFSRRYRCITYAARGYPPSDVPDDPGQYSQDHAVRDAVAVLDALEVAQAHVVGLSMGGFCALNLGLDHPDRVRSIVAAGVGYGAMYDTRAAFQAECEQVARAFEREGAAGVAARYALGPARVQLLAKDPRGHQRFVSQLGEHSSTGAALTMRGFQKARPSLYDYRDRLAGLEIPVLIMGGDEDEGALEPSLMLKRTIRTAGLVVLPRTGHTLNLEEPELFNHLVGEFLCAVEGGAWRPRDPRARTSSTMGMTD